MLRTTEQKRKYIQATRSQNYQASLKLEGITTTTQTTETTQTTQQSKAEILQKYKKYSQPESGGVSKSMLALNESIIDIKEH